MQGMRRRLAAASTIALMAAAGAVAQEAGPGDDDIEIIHVETTRTQIPAFDYPGLTSVIDSETLDLIDPVTLDELLRTIPGMEVGGGPRRTGQTLSLRGLGRENVVILLDGARQNFNSAHDGVVFIDPALLSQVEAVRGPASALYGSGAAGGVVAFRTADPDDLLSAGQTLGGRVTAGYRSVDEMYSASLSAYARSEAGLDGLGSLNRRSSGDIALGSGADLPAEDDSLSGLFKLGLDAAPGVRLEAAWQFLNGEASEPNNGQGNAGVGALNPLVDKDIDTDTFQLTGEFAPAGLGWMDLDVTLYQSTSNVFERETVSGRTVDRDLESTGVRADQRFDFALGAFDAGLTIGGEYYSDEQSGFDSAAPGNVRGGVPDASTDFTAGFVQLELTGAAPFGLPGEIVLLPGVRFDDFESESAIAGSNADSATSGRFGVSYGPTDQVILFANWAEAFRAPSVNEVYLDGTHFSLPHPVLGPPVFITNEFIANPDLRPETTETIEVGIGLAFDGVAAPGDRLELKGSYYETDAEDLISLFVDFAFDPTCFAPPAFLPCSAGVTNSANVGSATLSGYELQASYDNGGLSIEASLSENDGTDDATGEPVGQLSPRRLFIDTRYQFESAPVLAGVRAELASAFDNVTDPAQIRDGYTVVDLYARWRPFEDRGFTLTGGVDNVFDEDYSRVFAGASEAGRSIRVGFSWSGGR